MKLAAALLSGTLRQIGSDPALSSSALPSISMSFSRSVSSVPRLVGTVRRAVVGLVLILGLAVPGGLVSFAQTSAVTELYAFTNYFGPSALVLAEDGYFYGTVGSGATSSLVFKIDPTGSLTNFASFTNAIGLAAEGGPLLQEKPFFFGAAHGGGSFGLGSLFRVDLNHSVARLGSFNGTNGAYPSGALTLGNDGSHYGTTAFGGPTYRSNVFDVPGTVFRLTTNGVLETLVAFNGTNGANPQASLVWGTDGNLYGTTVAGGSQNQGTIFKVTPTGRLTTLVHFDGTNGANPTAALLLANNGAFYGTTTRGGTRDLGTVFALTTNGLLTTLLSFDGPSGAYPSASLIQGRDGGLYGTTEFGGPDFKSGVVGNDGFGTAFRLSFAGDLITLAAFDDVSGSHPTTALVQGVDGNFYGTSSSGGQGGYGNVYRFASRFVAGLTVDAAGVYTLGWNTIKGFKYQAQGSTNLNSAIWIDLGTPTVATGNALSLVVGPASPKLQFYRVRQLP